MNCSLPYLHSAQHPSNFFSTFFTLRIWGVGGMEPGPQFLHSWFLLSVFQRSLLITLFLQEELAHTASKERWGCWKITTNTAWLKDIHYHQLYLSILIILNFLKERRLFQIKGVTRNNQHRAGCFLVAAMTSYFLFKWERHICWPCREHIRSSGLAGLSMDNLTWGWHPTGAPRSQHSLWRTLHFSAQLGWCFER